MVIKPRPLSFQLTVAPIVSSKTFTDITLLVIEKLATYVL